MATTLNAATLMGKNYSTMQNVVKNEESLTLKQMFDVTAQIIHNEEEIYCLDKIEATEILRMSVESLRNSSGIFSQDSHRCSSVTKSAIF